jgi:hypothetical protein
MISVISSVVTESESSIIATSSLATATSIATSSFFHISELKLNPNLGGLTSATSSFGVSTSVITSATSSVLISSLTTSS